MDPLAAMVGLLVGIVVGLTSLGGGALLTPAVVLVLGVPPSVAVGTDVFIAAFMKLIGGGAYALKGQVHWQTVRRLAAGSVPGAVLGIVLLNGMSPGMLEGFVGKGLGAAMVITAALTLRRLLSHGHHEPKKFPRATFTIVAGFVTGLLVAMTSVGSGSILMAALIYFFPMGGRRLVGTDLMHALFLSVAATIGHFASGRVDVALAAGVLVGAIPGVLIGVRLAGVVPERPLRFALVTVLALAGLKMLSDSFDAPTVVAALFQGMGS